MRTDRPRRTHRPDPPSLWDTIDPPVIIESEEPPPGSIQEAFLRFHAANPWVYEALRRLANDLVAGGRRTVGIGMLTEVVRWQYTRATVDPASDFKINNNYRSRYARLLMEQEPALAGVFTLRLLLVP